MIKIQQVLMLGGLLAVAGCGCVDDSFQSTTPNRLAAGFILGARVPKIVIQNVQRIDVLFLIDDSSNFASGYMLGDGRSKKITAERVFRNLVENFDADLTAAGITADTAFGVARYEDYGGPFRSFDAQARPFILQQPILRSKNPQFLTAIQNAMTDAYAPVPPVGSPRLVPTPVGPGTGNNGVNKDAVTGIEALWQAATGLGFDGNGNANTTESGPAGDPLTISAPGASGDVPAPVYAAAGNDPDLQPQYDVGGKLSSGNVGGVGWRPDSKRYIIVVSDRGTVSPFTATDPNLGAPQFGFADVTNTPGACRDAKAIPAGAFFTVSPPDPRSGNGATVGPTGRHTVQDAITALNDKDIEVLAIGTTNTAGRGGKPNQPNPPIVPGPSPQGPIRAIPSPTNPDPSPFTWMSAVAILTGAFDTDPADATTVAGMPLVYNLLTVFPKPPAGLPDVEYDAASMTNDVREDLVDRVLGCGIVLPPPPAIAQLQVQVDTAGTPFLVTATARQLPVAGQPADQTLAQFEVPNQPGSTDVEVRWLISVDLIDPVNTAVPVEANVPVRIVFPGGGSIAGFTEPVGTVRLRAVDPAVESPRATLSSVTAGCFYFQAAAPGVSDPGFPISSVPALWTPPSDHYYCAPFTFP